MKTSINKRILQYQESINNNDMPSTYKFLIDTMNQIQRNFVLDSFSTKSVLNGYLDYTYFYFDDDFLRSQGLKLGLILNHQAMAFELWLMGRTKPIQEKYWNLLKDTPLNHFDEMPQWFIVSMNLVTHPKFEDLDALTDTILKTIPIAYAQIHAYL
ncbi:hypothetical protein LLS04_05315 [Erysipelothrix enhydrae]|uniref:DUF7000 family protein n=1 Tax=Erysipelothrix enhydrae TaxID=2890314 RepID=UPI002B24D738|nr:hypothetical protein [Erysipelothrix sp. 4322-04]WRB86396.1 hypothetical protein LLS04_05315 [Erysipelothrix sp. 4322-04]